MKLTETEYQNKYSKELEELKLKGFYRFHNTKDNSYYENFKTGEITHYYHLGTITYTIFFNPITCEVKSVWYIDWEREGMSDFINEKVDNISVSDCPLEVVKKYEEICEVKKTEYKYENNIICEGDTVKVIKGRKLPIGSIKTIKEFPPYYDMYNRLQCVYAVFTDGTRTNKNNLQLIKGE